MISIEGLAREKAPDNLFEGMGFPPVSGTVAHIYALAIDHVHRIGQLVNGNLVKNRREHVAARDQLDDHLQQLQQDRKMSFRVMQLSQDPQSVRTQSVQSVTDSFLRAARV